MYKLSQDHVEFFFQAVRSKGGCNNNPTARQFKAAYKKLIVHAEIRGTSKGNCIRLDNVSILMVSSASKPAEGINATVNGFRYIESHADRDGADHEQDLGHDLFTEAILSSTSEQIVFYLSGFISFHLMKKLKCEHCVGALYTREQSPTSLISYKSGGGLIYPSKEVFCICKKCEFVFRNNVSDGNGMCLKKDRGLLQSEITVLRALNIRTLFSQLVTVHDNSGLENHVSLLIRAIIKKYLVIRYQYWAKNLLTTPSLRQHYTKAILFRGQ
jgi:hypothetical protein